jgi:hypothetical protein
LDCGTFAVTQLFEDGLLFSFVDLHIGSGEQISIPNVWFTQEGFGPVNVIAWWEQGYLDPIYLVTNFDLPGEACYWYKKRFQIETFFSDEKSCGFNIQRSHLFDPEHIIDRGLPGVFLDYLFGFCGPAKKLGKGDSSHRSL